MADKKISELTEKTVPVADDLLLLVDTEDTPNTNKKIKWSNIAKGRTATYVVAASDAPAHVKAQADYVCDGTADNVEIQAAIDALPVIGGTVQLSQGTFTAAAQISLKKLCSLIGSGGGRATTIILADNVNDDVLSYIQTDSASSFVYIGYLTIYGNKANQTSGNGILIDWDGTNTVKDVEIDRVYVNGADDDGIKVDNSAWGIHIHDCNSESCDVNAYYLKGNQSYIHDCYASESYYGFRIVNINMFMNNCYALNSTDYDFYFQGCNQVKASNCKAFSAAGNSGGFYIRDTVYSSFVNIESHGKTGAGVDIRNSSNNLLSNVIVQGNSGTYDSGIKTRDTAINNIVNSLNISDCTVGILEQGSSNNNSFINGYIDTATVATPATIIGAKSYVNGISSYISRGEIRTISGTIATLTENAFNSLDNPFGQVVRVLALDVYVSTAATATTPNIDCGIGASATTDYATLFDDLTGETVGFYTSTIAALGTQTAPQLWDSGSGNRYLNMSIKGAAATGMVATYVVTVMGI